MRRSRERGVTGAALARGVGAVALLGIAAACTPAETDGALRSLQHLETVHADLAADGEVVDATLHTRLEAAGTGEVRIADPAVADDVDVRGSLWPAEREGAATIWRPNLDDGPAARELTSTYPADQLPLAVRIIYVLDGEPVTPDDLEEATGDVQLRLRVTNVSAAPVTISYPSTDGEQVETVDVALPLLADLTLQLPPSWRFVDSEQLQVAADPDGGSTARWTGATFAPIGDEVTEFVVDATVHDAELPTLVLDASPVTGRSLHLLDTAEDLLEGQAASSAIAAVFGEALAEAAAEAADGADDLAGGLAEVADAVTEAADDLPDLDPGQLTDQALDELQRAIDPGAIFDDVFDPDALLADLEAQLADVDLGAALGPLIADAFDDLAPDPAELERRLDRALTDIEEGFDLTEVLASIDLDDLLADADLDGAIEAAIGDLTVGEVLPDASLSELVRRLLDRDDLEVDLADALGTWLDDNDVELPTVDAQRLDETLAALTVALAVADDLAEATDAAIAGLAGVGDDLDELLDSAPLSGIADVSDAVADQLHELADRLDDSAFAELDAVDAAIDAADDQLAAVLATLDDAADELEDDAASALAPVEDAVRALDDAIGALAGSAAALRAALTETFDELAPAVRAAADELDDLVTLLRDPDLLADLVDDQLLDPALTTLDAVRIAAVGASDDLDAAVDLVAQLADELDGEVDLRDVLRAALDDGTLDLAPVLDAVDARLDDRSEELDLTDRPLVELLGELDITGDQLVADLDLVRFTDALAELDVELPALLDVLDLDLDELLAELAPPTPEDPLEGFDDVDPEVLLAAAGLEPAELLRGIDATEFDDLLADLGADLDGLLGELGLGELDQLDEAVDGFAEALTELTGGADELADGLDQLAEDGLAELVTQLDDGNRDAQRDLALLRALDDRAAQAHPTLAPTDATTGSRYLLATSPGRRTAWEPWAAGAGLLVVAALLATRSRAWNRLPTGSE